MNHCFLYLKVLEEKVPCDFPFSVKLRDAERAQIK